jgi:uncharacterized protein (TIGR02391 family)
MKSFSELVPTAEQLLELEPEELAGVLLEYLNSISKDEADSALNRHNFAHPARLEGYFSNQHEKVLRALMEAWSWLEREGLLAPRPRHTTGDWVFVTRRGEKLRSRTDVQAFRKANLLPKELLHPVIAGKVWSLFIRGEYDTAVFQAFKEVEVAVRIEGNYPAEVIGVDLMRQAFHPKTGTLTSRYGTGGEKQALCDLFAGAIGSYKNPNSHRHVGIDAPQAVEMLILASHLLRIVDTRALENELFK